MTDAEKIELLRHYLRSRRRILLMYGDGRELASATDAQELELIDEILEKTA